MWFSTFFQSLPKRLIAKTKDIRMKILKKEVLLNSRNYGFVDIFLNKLTLNEFLVFLP